MVAQRNTLVPIVIVDDFDDNDDDDGRLATFVCVHRNKDSRLKNNATRIIEENGKKNKNETRETLIS